MRYPINRQISLQEDRVKYAVRRKGARVTVETVHRTEQESVLELIGQAWKWSLPSGTALADASYANNLDFRQELRERRLPDSVALESWTMFWLTSPQVPLALAERRGRPRLCPRLPDSPPVSSLLEAARKLLSKAWRNANWRIGARRHQASRSGSVEAWAAHAWKAWAYWPLGADCLMIEWAKDVAELATSECPGILPSKRLPRTDWPFIPLAIIGKTSRTTEDSKTNLGLTTSRAKAGSAGILMSRCFRSPSVSCAANSAAPREDSGTNMPMMMKFL